MQTNATIAALLLICAGIMHNYSFMCRKIDPQRLKVVYPSTVAGRLGFDLAWILVAAYGFLLSFELSALLTAVAAAIYFLLFPFLLQPPLARLLGFRNLKEYVDHIDRLKTPPSEDG